MSTKRVYFEPLRQGEADEFQMGLRHQLIVAHAGEHLGEDTLHGSLNIRRTESDSQDGRVELGSDPLFHGLRVQPLAKCEGE